jgi:hypothetical protein
MPEPDPSRLDPGAAQAIARVRRLMAISLAVTALAIAGVMLVVGYRFFRQEGSGAPADVTASLPKGARVLATAVGEGRIVLTIDVGGQSEIRTFDARTLQPTGRLRLLVEP